LMDATHLGVGPVEPIELAVVVDRSIGRPQFAEDFQVLVGTPIPLVVVEVVAVALLLGVAAAGDDVHSEAAGAELVEGGQLAGGHRGRNEPRAVSQQYPKVFGVGEGIGGDDETVGAGRVIADQDAVEAGLFVDLSQAPGVGDVDHRPLGGMDFRLLAGRDEADELDGQGILLLALFHSPDDGCRPQSLPAAFQINPIMSI
jgi:hypothetical protein